ncbi:MAG TPA: FtsQ-type POTRA domain-containing protein [Candidatus Eisenbacteria bacterium]|jgi:cell division septal protein FtsQ|nr:FtsQ-type POTRA domain-containing protein [Candidatus Eisenbacteria bacterium]
MRAGYAGLPTYKRPARRRRNRRILLLGLMLLLTTLAAPFLAQPCERALGVIPFFRAERIEVTGLLYLSPDEVRSWIPVRERENLLLIHPDEVASALALHPRIASARVSRHPGRLRIDVTERRTFLLVNAGTLLEVDQSGTILSPLDRGLVADRPVLSGVPFPTVKPGARVTTARLRDILHLVEVLESPEVGLVSDVSEVVSEDPHRAILRLSRDHIPVTVDPERATVASMRALSAALRDLRERERHVLSVDARYRGQVVVRCAPEDSLSAALPPRGTT